MKKQYTLVLNFGFAESQHTGFVPWTSKQKFADAKEALLDLANFLKEQYVGSKEPMKSCCQATVAKTPDASFCSKCGHKLEVDEFDGEAFTEWLVGLNTDTDTLSADYVEWDPDHRWQTGSLEGAPNQRFVYNAEHVLAAAVGHNYFDHLDFAEICKRRTKAKVESFNYW